MLGTSMRLSYISFTNCRQNPPNALCCRSEAGTLFRVFDREEIVAKRHLTQARGIGLTGAVVLLLIFALTLCAQSPSGTAPKAEGSKPSDAPQGDATTPPKLPTDYKIGAEDELTISVWHEPELSQAVVVRPDGLITLPLLNELKVLGLTTDELQALLTEKLKAVVNDPQVTVIVKAVHSRKVFVMGNIAKQGVYPLGGKKTVLELIAEAGGLGPFAKTHSIYILRKSGGNEIRIPFNYKKALSGKSDNPELLPGDMVVVP
jgi:polysaccharide biosynthesis/export protein